MDNLDYPSNLRSTGAHPVRSPWQRLALQVRSAVAALNRCLFITSGRLIVILGAGIP
jgi:hypothetical protein